MVRMRTERLSTIRIPNLFGIRAPTVLGFNLEQVRYLNPLTGLFTFVLCSFSVLWTVPLFQEILWQCQLEWRKRFQALISKHWSLKKQAWSWGWFYKWFCTLTPNFCALRLTFVKLFTGANVGRRAQKISAGRKTVYEINPLSEHAGKR